ncbi:hypothetical protein RA274_28695, partial [Pseudomonas syringae pv. tagetis]
CGCGVVVGGVLFWGFVLFVICVVLGLVGFGAEICEFLRTKLAQLQNNPRVRVLVGGESRLLTVEKRKRCFEECEMAINE